jgi:2-alkyl-3-oxoalkanoate reductase
VTRVAIVGAAGFIGGRAAEMLRLRGWADVNAVVRSYSSAARIARLSHDFKLADALREEELVEAFNGCDFVFHAIVGDERTIVEAPAVAARAARRAGVKRIVYLSSGMVFGFSAPPGTDDESPPDTRQPKGYNRSKALAEMRIAALRDELGVDVVVLRPTVVYGPRSAQFTVEVATQILAGTAYLVGGGSGICNAVYVDNLVGAMWQAATTPEAANQAFIVSDLERNTWRDLYYSVAAGVGVSSESIHSVPSDVARRIVENGRHPGRLESFLHTDLAGRMRAALPARTEVRLRAAALAFLSAGNGAEPALGLDLDYETVQLQLCDHQLPVAKAQGLLGYEPLPSEEGFRRTNVWLAGAGFRSDF